MDANSKFRSLFYSEWNFYHLKSPFNIPWILFESQRVRHIKNTRAHVSEHQVESWVDSH